MTAGARNRRVTLRIPSVSNVKGEQVTTWTTKERWAQWIAAGASERYGADQHYSEATGQFRFHSDSVSRAIDGTYQITDDGVTYEVLGAVDPDGRKVQVWVFVRHPARQVS